ncbi:MAG: hypothetical protein PVJ68_19465 [Candidatus Thiodiazotropha sp.]|jgi:hypothetical protein
MSLSIRRIFNVTLKSILVTFGLVVLGIVGLLAYMELKSRPPGSPPPGYEDRLKYDLEQPPGSRSTTKTPVDLWFGRRDGKYDTTHLCIGKDYFGIRPHYHGEGAHINTIWPSLQSRHEYGRVRDEAGLPYESDKDFTMVLTEAKPTGSGDKNGTESFYECEPVIHDEARGVKYCNEKRKIDASVERFTNYWPLDKTIRTPWYKNPPNAHCNVIERLGQKRFDGCSIYFSYNADVDVSMLFVPEQLAIEIISDFTRLTDFLSTLEVKP